MIIYNHKTQKKHRNQMRKTLLTITLTATLLISCGKKEQKFTIDENKIGPLTKGALINQVDSIFKNDSIVSRSGSSSDTYQGQVEIYDKEGHQLLVLSPEDQEDKDSPITHIQITDARYQTNKGIGMNSTYKDIKKHYTVDKIQTTFSSIIVFLKDSPIYFSIDKNELPEDLRYNLNLTVEPTQIPDDAKIKLFMISWDLE